MPFQLSPGVAVVEKDLSTIVPAVGSSVGAFAGSFAWGPCLQPTTISSENNLVSIFGKPNDSNATSFFPAANFLSYTNNLMVVRTNPSKGRNAASGYLSSVDTAGSAIKSTITVTNSGSGYLGDSYAASVPSVVIGAPDVAGGTQAVATAVITGGEIATITVTGSGDYLVAPSQKSTQNQANTIYFGTDWSAAQANVGDQRVYYWSAADGGPRIYTIIAKTANPDGSYTTLNSQPAAPVDNPTIGTTFTSGSYTVMFSGYQARFTIITEAGTPQSDGTPTVKVTGVKITNPGSGYYAVPLVGGTGTYSNLSMTVTLNKSVSVVKSITVTNAGSGYKYAPTITIGAPASSTGVTATAEASLVSVAAPKILNASDFALKYAAGGNGFGEFAAKYPGTLGNSLAVSYADSASYSTWAYKANFDVAPGTSTYAASVGGSNDEMHIVIYDKLGVWTGAVGTVLEKFGFVSKAKDAKKPDGTRSYYKDVLNSTSEYVWCTDLPTGNTTWGTNALSTSFSTVSSAFDKQLLGGNDDYTMSDADQINAYNLFANAEMYDVNLIIAGKASTTVARTLADLAQTRADCVAFISPQNVQDGQPIIGNTSSETDKIIAYRNAMNTIHSYAVMDSGYKYQYDTYNDTYRWVPLNGDVAGLCARTDYTNDPWWSPGGYNRGQVKGVVRLAHNPDKANRDNLYKAQVNPVVAFPGQGTILYGDKTMQTKPSAFDRINVRRLFIVLEKAIATAAKYQLFEFNDSFTRSQFKNMIEPFLRDVQGRRGIVDFLVKCDDSNNPGSVIDRNEFVADIYIKPNRSINFITLNFVAARSSASFSELGA